MNLGASATALALAALACGTSKISPGTAAPPTDTRDGDAEDLVTLDEPGREPRRAIRYRFERGQKQKLFSTRKFDSADTPPAYAVFEQSVVAADDRTITIEVAMSVSNEARAAFPPFEATFTTGGTHLSVEPYPDDLEPWLFAFGPIRLPVAWPDEPIGPGATWRTAFENERASFVVSHILLGLTDEQALVATDVTFDFNEDARRERANARRKLLGLPPAEPDASEETETHQAALFSVSLARPTAYATSRMLTSTKNSSTENPDGPLMRVAPEATPGGHPRPMPGELLRDVFEDDYPELPHVLHNLGRLRDEATIPLLVERLEAARGPEGVGFQVSLSEITGRKQRSSRDLEDAAEELFLLGARDEAVRLLDRAATKADVSSRRAAFTLAAARLLRRAGALPETDAHLKRALAEDENDPEALNALAWWRATAPEASYRAPAEALALALRLAGHGIPNVEYLRTLAAAYAANGEFGRAAALQKEAISRSKELYFSRGRAERWARYLTSYEKGRPVVQKPDKDDVRDPWFLP